MVEKLNEENLDLHKQVREMRQMNDLLNGEVLLKNQIIEDNKMKMVGEIQILQSELEALQHKYDRKELILQNHERKMNLYEIYITKQASKYGRNDQEADQLIKKF